MAFAHPANPTEKQIHEERFNASLVLTGYEVSTYPPDVMDADLLVKPAMTTAGCGGCRTAEKGVPPAPRLEWKNAALSARERSLLQWKKLAVAFSRSHHVVRKVTLKRTGSGHEQ